MPKKDWTPLDPTRLQPPRAAKPTLNLSYTALAANNAKTQTTIGGRVTKTTTSPPSTSKTLKRSLSNSATKSPDKLQKTAGYVPDDGYDSEDAPGVMMTKSQLKPTDLAIGNVISTAYHGSYNNYYVTAKEKDYVRNAGDNCGLVHSKYRKFVIVALFKAHFIGLPIYSKRLDHLEKHNDHDELAEVLDTDLRRFKPPRIPRPRPLCRGRVKDEWLWSEAVLTLPEGKSWARMADTSTVWITKPVVHDFTVKAKLVSKLDKESTERLLRWTRDAFVGELEKEIRVYWRLVDRQSIG